MAGLSLAVALRHRGIPVRVLEAEGYPRHRVCGEFISGVSAETLEALRIAPLFGDAAEYRTVAWFDSGKLFHRDTLPIPAIGISRHCLDERLFLLARSLGCEIITRHRARPEPVEGLVWAAGRRPRRGRWIGLKAHLRGLPQEADLEMHLGSKGYAGLVPVENGWTNLCGLFLIDRSIQAKGRDLLPAYLETGGSPALAQAVRHAVWRENSFSSVAGFEPGPQTVVPGLLCLGDADRMIPPFTGNGMSMAFQAAETAVGPLASWSAGSISWENASRSIQDGMRRKFRRRLQVAGWMHPVLLSSSGRACLRALATARLLPFRTILSLVR